ncbi:MAG: EamA family transporter [Nitrospirota bacterium]
MAYIITAIILWSSLGLVIRLSALPVHVLIFYSNLISSLLLGLLVAASPQRDEVTRIGNRRVLLVLGPIALVNTFSFFYAYRTTTIANAVLTHYTAPLFVAFLAPVFLKEKVTRRILFAILAGGAGLWIMLDLSARTFIGLLLAGDRNTAGIVAGLFSGFAYAVLIIVFRKVALSSRPLIMTLFQNIVVCLLLLPFAAWSAVPLSELWLLLLTGTVHSTVAPLLYFKGLQQVTSSRAAILGYLEPLCAILLGMLFLNETVTLRVVAGGALILLSGYLIVRERGS